MPERFPMITQAEAQAHAKLCGVQGRAVPISSRFDDNPVSARLAEPVRDPETQDVVYLVGSKITNVQMALVAKYYGIDYIMTC